MLDSDHRIGLWTRQPIPAERNSPSSAIRRRSYDVPYNNIIPAVRSLSNSPKNDGFQAFRRSRNYNEAPADLGREEFWPAKSADLQPLQTGHSYVQTEAEQNHTVRLSSDRLSNKSGITNDTDTSDGRKSRLTSRLGSSRRMIQAQGAKNSPRQNQKLLESRRQSTFPWPDKVIEGLHDLRKHRTRLSFHGQTFREQYEYVKDERNQLANVVAILLQEVGNTTGIVLNSSRIQTLGEDIARRHAVLGRTEAQLDTIKDLILQTERSLQVVEEELCTYIIPDGTSNDADVVGDLFGSILSESFSSTKSISSVDRSEPELENVHAEGMMQPQTSSHAHYRLQVALQGTDSRSVAKPTDPIVIQRPYLVIDAEPVAEGTDVQPFWDSNLASYAAVRQIQNVTPELQWIGEQYWENYDIHQYISDDPVLTELLAASPWQIFKRQHDLAQILSQALNLFCDPTVDESLSDLSVTSGITYQLLHITRRSWLEFSRFAIYFNEFARTALSLRALLFEDIDTMLERVSFAQDSLVYKTPPSSMSEESSLTSIKLGVLNESVSSHARILIDKSENTGPEILARIASPNILSVDPPSIHSKTRTTSLAARPMNEPRTRLARPSSLPGDLSKSDFTMIRFPTL